MRGLVAGSLCVGLAVWATGVRGQEPRSLPPVVSTVPAASQPPSNSNDLPKVTLGRPVAIPAADPVPPASLRTVDHAVTPVAFSPPLGTIPQPIMRTVGPDGPQPLPAGPPLEPTGDSKKPSEMPGVVVQKPGVLRPIPAVPETAPAPRPVSTTAVDDDCVCPDCDGPGICSGGGCGLWGQRGNCFDRTNCVWFSGEYLLWWTKGSRLPALVTTSPAGTSRDMAGVLGSPGTTVLFGNQEVNPDERSGGRFGFGFWFDEENTLGLEASFFFLGDRSLNFNAGSAGSPILARPFFDVLRNREASELIAFPGVIGGNAAVSLSSRLTGADLNLRTNLWQGCCWRLDWLTGFRYLGLDESLGIVENLMVAPGVPGVGGSVIGVSDSFGTHNNFFGGQIGTDLELRWRRWSVNWTEKLALGSTHEVVNINGSTTFFPAIGMPSVQMGGLLAQPSNIGRYSRDRFAVVPETGVKIGYQLTDHAQAFIAYSLIYISDVARPAAQIDRGVNTTQLPSQLGPGTLSGTPRPFLMFKGSDFWAQGVSFGLEFRY